MPVPVAVSTASVSGEPPALAAHEYSDGHGGPGSWIYYKMPTHSALREVTFGITVVDDPGLGNVFWSNQFHFTNAVAGYVGMQRHRDGTGQFLYSLWNAGAARAGDKDTSCRQGTDGGQGFSCLSNTRFLVGHAYLFHVVPDGDSWFQARVEDTTLKTSITLGSIRVGPGAAISPANMSSWVEYFDWNNKGATCLDEPYSQAQFDAPSANNSTVIGTVSGDKTSKPCRQQVEVTTAADHAITRNGIGNSAGQHVTTPAGACLTATPAGVDTIEPCRADSTQAWVAAADGTLRANFSCLTGRNSGPLSQAACVGATAQLWSRTAAGYRNSGSPKCLSAGKAQVVLAPCDGLAARTWNGPS